MRISIKLTLALTVIGLLIFIGYGLYHLSIEQRDLERVALLQTRLLGTSLQIAIENAMRDKQATDIEELLKELEKIEPALEIRVYDQQSKAFPDIPGNRYSSDFQNELHAALKTGQETPFFYPGNLPEYIAWLHPLENIQGERIGALVLVRVLTEMQRDLDVTRRNLSVSVIAFIGITTPLCTVLCWLYIGWPLKRLIDGMGRIRNGDFSPLQLKNPHDEIGQLSLAFNDMATELETAQRKLKEEAQSRLHVQTALQEADKMIIIGQLSAGLAHEIGSPLQILKGRGEHLLQCANRPEEVERHARILVAQTGRITRIVQQLLEFSRRKPTHFVDCDLRIPVNSVLNLLEYEAARKQVELSFNVEGSPPRVYADSDGIQQIVLNLITNALTATAAGGHIVVTLTSAKFTSNFKSVEVDAVQLSVGDDGYGMSQDVLEHLFEPFFTTRHKQGGVGLGLAVTHAIVTAHHGVIKAESTPGQGSVVTLILPVNH